MCRGRSKRAGRGVSCATVGHSINKRRVCQKLSQQALEQRCERAAAGNPAALTTSSHPAEPFVDPAQLEPTAASWDEQVVGDALQGQ